MELSHHGFLEELLQGPKIKENDNSNNNNNWATFPSTNDQFFHNNNNGWNFDSSFDENTSSNPSFFSLFSSQNEPTFDYPFFNTFQTSTNNINETPFSTQDDYPSIVEDEEFSNLLLRTHSFDESNSCKIELEQQVFSSNIDNSSSQVFNMGLCNNEKKNKSKKLEGQPSKNLMAERRRRKRLNDRLSMLRSIVPKISKMDRTSILGDTIDYMKELLERINKLQEENEEGKSEISLIKNLNEIKPNDVLVRNSPKFNVDRRDNDTRIDICCSTKPGLLLSTVHTLEALGLEIQQCVISCFNDFSLRASCSEDGEQRTMLSPEDIKQALFRNAGYGGRCL